MFKKSLFFIMLSFFCTAVLALPQPRDTVQTLDRIVAVVNKSIITEVQLDQQIKMYRLQAKAQGHVVPGLHTLRIDVLNNMIDQQLQMQLAQRNNIKISNIQLNNAIHTIARQNHLGITQLRQQIENTGQSYTAYRAMVRKQLLIQEIQKQAVASHVVIGPDEISAYVQKHQNSGVLLFHVQDILLSGSTMAKSMSVATHILQQLQKKKLTATESALSKATSGSSVSVNDLGWQSKQSLPDLFAKYLTRSSKSGQFVGPIKAPNGIHILKITGVKSSHTGMTKQQAQMMIFQQKFQANLKTWLDQLRHSAYIQVML